MTGRTYLERPFGAGYKVNRSALDEAFDSIDGSLVSYDVVAKLRAIANEIESEAARLREGSDGLGKLGDREAQLLESAVAELGKLGIVHDERRAVGVLARTLGPVFGVVDGHAATVAGGEN